MYNIMPAGCPARFTVIDDLDEQPLSIQVEKVEVDIAKQPSNGWSVWKPLKLLDFGQQFCTVERVGGPYSGEVEKVATSTVRPAPNNSTLAYLSDLLKTGHVVEYINTNFVWLPAMVLSARLFFLHHFKFPSSSELSPIPSPPLPVPPGLSPVSEDWSDSVDSDENILDAFPPSSGERIYAVLLPLHLPNATFITEKFTASMRDSVRPCLAWHSVRWHNVSLEPGHSGTMALHARFQGTRDEQQRLQLQHEMDAFSPTAAGGDAASSAAAATRSSHEKKRLAWLLRRRPAANLGFSPSMSGGCIKIGFWEEGVPRADCHRVCRRRLCRKERKCKAQIILGHIHMELLYEQLRLIQTALPSFSLFNILNLHKAANDHATSSSPSLGFGPEPLYAHTRETALYLQQRETLVGKSIQIIQALTALSITDADATSALAAAVQGLSSAWQCPEGVSHTAVTADMTDALNRGLEWVLRVSNAQLWKRSEVNYDLLTHLVFLGDELTHHISEMPQQAMTSTVLALPPCLLNRLMAVICMQLQLANQQPVIGDTSLASVPVYSQILQSCDVIRRETGRADSIASPFLLSFCSWMLRSITPLVVSSVIASIFIDLASITQLPQLPPTLMKMKDSLMLLEAHEVIGSLVNRAVEYTAMATISAAPLLHNTLVLAYESISQGKWGLGALGFRRQCSCLVSTLAALSLLHKNLAAHQQIVEHASMAVCVWTWAARAMDMVCQRRHVQLSKLLTYCGQSILVFNAEELLRTASAAPGSVGLEDAINLMVALLSRFRRVDVRSLMRSVSLAVTVRKMFFASSLTAIPPATRNSIRGCLIRTLRDWQGNGRDVQVGLALTPSQKADEKRLIQGLSVQLQANVAAMLTGLCDSSATCSSTACSSNTSSIQQAPLVSVHEVTATLQQIQAMENMDGVKAVTVDVLRTGLSSVVPDWRGMVGQAWGRFASRSGCPHSPACSYWLCDERGGKTEAALPTKLCAGCRRVRYCSVRCQQQAWRAGHREDCGCV